MTYAVRTKYYGEFDLLVEAGSVKEAEEKASEKCALTFDLNNPTCQMLDLHKIGCSVVRVEKMQ